MNLFHVLIKYFWSELYLYFYHVETKTLYFPAIQSLHFIGFMQFKKNGDLNIMRPLFYLS